MERLGHIREREIRQGNWKPIYVGHRGPGVSHLFKADDLFLFGRATEDQANVIKRVLDEFSHASGAKVSLEKSQLFLSPSAAKGQA
ncbi:reverse transcriptase, partial [Corchorus olitorius]